MDYSPKTLQRGLPVQRSSSADGTSAEVTTAIEKYARGIFHVSCILIEGAAKDLTQ